MAVGFRFVRRNSKISKINWTFVYHQKISKINWTFEIQRYQKSTELSLAEAAMKRTWVKDRILLELTKSYKIYYVLNIGFLGGQNAPKRPGNVLDWRNWPMMWMLTHIPTSLRIFRTGYFTMAILTNLGHSKSEWGDGPIRLLHLYRYFTDWLCFRFNRYCLTEAELAQIPDETISCLCPEACLETRLGPTLFCG